MFHALAKHGHFDLLLHCKGDLMVDDHHTAEDCAITLGSAFDQALFERTGIARYFGKKLYRPIIPISDTGTHMLPLMRP